MFRASLCPSSGEQRPCYWIWCVVLVLTSCKTAPHNRYQPHPAEPEHTKCSNRAFVLLKMDIMMPEICWDRSNNKHLIVASCWVISIHTSILCFTMLMKCWSSMSYYLPYITYNVSSRSGLINFFSRLIAHRPYTQTNQFPFLFPPQFCFLQIDFPLTFDPTCKGTQIAQVCGLLVS